MCWLFRANGETKFWTLVSSIISIYYASSYDESASLHFDTTLELMSKIIFVSWAGWMFGQSAMKTKSHTPPCIQSLLLIYHNEISLCFAVHKTAGLKISWSNDKFEVHRDMFIHILWEVKNQVFNSQSSSTQAGAHWQVQFIICNRTWFCRSFFSFLTKNYQNFCRYEILDFTNLSRIFAITFSGKFPDMWRFDFFNKQSSGNW